MDSAAAVMSQSLPFSSSCYYVAAKELRATPCKSVAVGRRRATAIGIISSEYSDLSHLQYYNCKNSGSYLSSPAGAALSEAGMAATMEDKVRVPKKMKKKKQVKLLKELSRDLSTFSQIGFGLDADGALVDQVERDMMTEAANLLLERLQKVRAEEKEVKRKAKEEKARLKAQMKTKPMDCEMSSTSSCSSESSESECGEVVDMKSLKKQGQCKQENCLPQVIDVNPIPIQVNPMEVILCAKPGTLTQETALKPEIPKKIEVCMGGKCKKSGGVALLEEFQKAVGIEGAVSGCKCMGKCKEGPNVKVVNGTGGENSVGAVQASNALCIGVGLQDVERIVANFMTADNQLGIAAAS